jgi:hypothetical protein
MSSCHFAALYNVILPLLKIPTSVFISSFEYEVGNVLRLYVRNISARSAVKKINIINWNKADDKD